MWKFRNKSKKSAEILCYGEIGASWWSDETVTAKKFREELEALGDVEQIDLRINSYGGDVFEGLAIHRALVEHKANVTSHIDGAAMSIASVIAMAGSKIIIAESGSLMIHDAMSGAFGNAEAFRDIAARLEATSEAIANVYVKARDLKFDDVRKLMKAETEWFGQAAVDAGFADEIAANAVKIAARAKPDFAKIQAILARSFQEEGGVVQPEPPKNEVTPPADQKPGDVVELDDERSRRLRVARVRLDRKKEQASGA